MFPGFVTHCSVNALARNAELFGQDRLGFSSIMALSNHSNLFCGELGASGVLTTTHWVASALVHIAGVFGARSEAQMSNARRPITGMKHVHAFWNWPVFKLPCVPVGGDRVVCPASVEGSVTTGCDRPFIYPARPELRLVRMYRAVLIDALPEALWRVVEIAWPGGPAPCCGATIYASLAFHSAHAIAVPTNDRKSSKRSLVLTRLAHAHSSGGGGGARRSLGKPDLQACIPTCLAAAESPAARRRGELGERLFGGAPNAAFRAVYWGRFVGPSRLRQARGLLAGVHACLALNAPLAKAPSVFLSRLRYPTLAANLRLGYSTLAHGSHLPVCHGPGRLHVAGPLQLAADSGSISARLARLSMAAAA